MTSPITNNYNKYGYEAWEICKNCAEPLWDSGIKPDLYNKNMEIENCDCDICVSYKNEETVQTLKEELEETIYERDEAIYERDRALKKVERLQNILDFIQKNGKMLGILKEPESEQELKENNI